jgi:hypothetical protein
VTRRGHTVREAIGRQPDGAPVRKDRYRAANQLYSRRMVEWETLNERPMSIVGRGEGAAAAVAG